MSPGNLVALQMLVATYDDVFLNTPSEIKQLLEEIYEGIEITEEEISNFLTDIDYEFRSVRKEKAKQRDGYPL